MRFVVAHPGMEFAVHDRFVGWVEALEAAGHAVNAFNLDERLAWYSRVKWEDPPGSGHYRDALDKDSAALLAVDTLYSEILRFRPHVLLLISGFFIPPQLMDIARFAGVKVVLNSTESPYDDDKYLELAKHCDLLLVDDPTNLDTLRQVCPTEYFPQCYRPSVHKPGKASPEMVCDFAFVGTSFPSRVRFFEAMDLRGLDVTLAGNWTRLHEASPLRQLVGHDLKDCLDNETAADLYRSAKVGINLYRREALHGTANGVAIGPREVEMAACGLFFLRDPRPEGDETLDMLPLVTDPAEASHVLRWWLARPDHREAAVLKAQAAIADRTFDNAAARLLRLLDK